MFASVSISLCRTQCDHSHEIREGRCALDHSQTSGFQILTFGPTAIRAPPLPRMHRVVWTRGRPPLRRSWRKKGGEEGDSHSKCVFTSDRVMTNNGGPPGLAPFQDSTQRVMYEKSDPGWLMTTATRLPFLGRKGRGGGGRGTGSSRERLKGVGGCGVNEGGRRPSIPGTWTCFLLVFILDVGYLYLFIPRFFLVILFYCRVEERF